MSNHRYCRKCYANLEGATDTCPDCETRFNPEDPKTHLPRPFPTRSQVFGHLVGTTLVAVAAAFVVALHQISRTSGH